MLKMNHGLGASRKAAQYIYYLAKDKDSCIKFFEEIELNAIVISY